MTVTGRDPWRPGDLSGLTLSGVFAALSPSRLVYDLPGQVQDGGVAVQHEVGVGGQDDPVELEGERSGSSSPGSSLLSGGREARTSATNPDWKAATLFLDRALPGAHL